MKIFSNLMSLHGFIAQPEQPVHVSVEEAARMELEAAQKMQKSEVHGDHANDHRSDKAS